MAKLKVSKRLREIVTTFMLEGLDVPMARMRLARCATWRCRAHCTWARWTGHHGPQKRWTHAVRDALVKLGPVFVKTGQILSVRSDLIPPELAEVLRGLQSNVPAVPFEAVRPTLEAELGPLEAKFKRLDEKPLAAASIAQVYEGELQTGQRVAVKVKRPGIDAVVKQDLDLIVWMAERLEKYVPESRAHHPVNAANELRRYTLQELDFRTEASVSTRVREAMLAGGELKVPEIFHASPNVIVMEFVDSFAADDLEAMDRHGVDRRAVVRTAVQVITKQIFEVGVFHADPHPGNLHVTPAGDFVMLDFGIFGQLDDRLRRMSALMMWTAGRGDTELTSLFMLRIATLEADADVGAFRRGIEDCYRAWLGKSIREYGFGKLVFEQMSVAARHGVRMPPDMVLFAKAMLTVEGVALALDPDLDISKEIQPYMEKVQKTLYDPARLRHAFERSLPVWWEVAERLPVGLAELVDRRWANPPPPAPAAAAPPSARFYSAALVVSGALLLGQRVEPIWFGVPALGAALLGVGLLGGLVRGRRDG